jgi:hypothetical protein
VLIVKVLPLPLVQSNWSSSEEGLDHKPPQPAEVSKVHSSSAEGPGLKEVPGRQAEQFDRRAEPAPGVMWPAGQSRQEVEAGTAWYFEAGQDTHADTAGAQSLKPRPFALSSE